MERKIEKLVPKEEIKNHQIIESPDWIDIEKVEKNTILDATVVSYSNGCISVRLHALGYSEVVKIQGKQVEKKLIQVKITEKTGSKAKNNLNLKAILIS